MLPCGRRRGKTNAAGSVVASIAAMRAFSQANAVWGSCCSYVDVDMDVDVDVDVDVYYVIMRCYAKLLLLLN